MQTVLTHVDGFLPLPARAPPAASYPGLSVTAVGARRGLVLGVQGVEEDVGLIGVHLENGDFVEMVPWNRWELRARGGGGHGQVRLDQQ